MKKDRYPEQRGYRVLAAWWRTGTVKGAAASLGIEEQTAKNELMTMRRMTGCRTNDQMLQTCYKALVSKGYGILDPNEKRKLRYEVDTEYRERMKRQARNAMRRKREVNRTLVVTEYDRLLAIQGNRCAICGSPERRMSYGNPRRLAVDHDHATGTIRELLCSGCNYMLGCAHDSPEVLEAGAVYLRRHREGTSHNKRGRAAERDNHAA